LIILRNSVDRVEPYFGCWEFWPRPLAELSRSGRASLFRPFRRPPPGGLLHFPGHNVRDLDRPIAQYPLASGSAPMRLPFDELQPCPECQFVIPRDDHRVPGKPAMPFQLIQRAPSLYRSAQPRHCTAQTRVVSHGPFHRRAPGTERGLLQSVGGTAKGGK